MVFVYIGLRYAGRCMVLIYLFVSCCVRALSWLSWGCASVYSRFFNRKRPILGAVKEFVANAHAGLVASEFASKAKYKVLTGKKHTVVVDGVKYCRIRALRQIDRPFGLPQVKLGDLGGFVAVSGVGAVLSHEGSCWVADEAFVAGHVSGESQVTGHAFVGVDSQVTGRSLVSDYAQVVDGAVVADSLVTDFAQVVGVSRRGLNPGFGGRAGQTRVGRYSWVSGRARVSDGVMVDRFGRVEGSAVVAGAVQVRRGSIVGGAVVLVGESALIDACGEVVDEPVNMWGCPVGFVMRPRLGEVLSFGDATANGERVFPYSGKGYVRVRESAQELANIFEVEVDLGREAEGGWAGLFDKSLGYPREVEVSRNGIPFFRDATEEDEKVREQEDYSIDRDAIDNL